MTDKHKEQILKRNWTLNQWKDSKDKLDRLVWFISIQSPHNLWRARVSIQELISKTQQDTIEGMKETLEEGEKKAIETMAKKYKTYNYDFMEGVFALKFAVQDILDKLKKESG